MPVPSHYRARIHSGSRGDSMERTAKPRRALLSANRDFTHTVSAQIVALNSQGAIMACYMKVPVGQEVYVRFGDGEQAYTAVVIPFENIRQLLSASPSPQ